MSYRPGHRRSAAVGLHRQYSVAGSAPIRQTQRMTTQLPTGYAARRATEADADLIFDIQAAHNVPVIGEPNCTVEDVADELIEPGFDVATDGWLVVDDAGRAVGWGWACRKQDSDNVDVAVFTRPDNANAAAWLWTTVQRRAVEIARDLGHPAVVIDTEVFGADKDKQALAEANGFAAARSFFRLRIDHDGVPPMPQPPTGLGAAVALRDGTDPTVRSDAHTVYQEAFADHFGFVATGFDAWVELRESSTAHDWAQLNVVYVDAEPAAMLLRTNAYVSDDDCGYVHTLATRPGFQGRGLGGYLLRYAFAVDAADGRAGTLLHVDTDPSRSALGLYQAAGMRIVQLIDIWRRTTTTTTDLGRP